MSLKYKIIMLSVVGFSLAASMNNLMAQDNQGSETENNTKDNQGSETKKPDLSAETAKAADEAAAEADVGCLITEFEKKTIELKKINEEMKNSASIKEMEGLHQRLITAMDLKAFDSCRTLSN